MVKQQVVCSRELQQQSRCTDSGPRFLQHQMTLVLSGSSGHCMSQHPMSHVLLLTVHMCHVPDIYNMLQLLGLLGCSGEVTCGQSAERSSGL